jgi:hypothetical protein
MAFVIGMVKKIDFVKLFRSKITDTPYTTLKGEIKSTPSPVKFARKVM